MNGFESGRRTYGSDRTVEIVSGRGYGVGVNNQIYATRPGSLSPATDPSRVTGAYRSGSSTAKPWGFTDAEAKRRKRIAKYKVYTVEGKVKDSLRKGLRWIKNKCSQIVHGY